MARIRLEDFGGMIPRRSDRLIPDNASSLARNTKLLTGEARGFRVPELIADFSALPYTIMKAYRVLDPPNPDAWLTFSSRDVDVVRSMILNDSFDRHYWTGGGLRPLYNTRARIVNGDSPWYLGVPQPTPAPTCVVNTPGTGPDEVRAYLYTFVSAYGEESRPSDPTLITVPGGSSVDLSNISITVPDAANRNIVKRKVYRTVVGNASTSYFYVGEINDMITTTFTDNLSDDAISLNNILESTFWEPPPDDLEGWVVMPNGYLIGWKGRTICFSEPYHPHAWPVEYQVSTEFEVVGMVVWGTAVVIGTKSQPYLGQGVTPQSFTMQKMDAVEPCLSRHGMVATVAGAYYPSLNGLVLVNAGGISVITTDVLTKEEWAAYNPGNIFAAALGLQYIAFNADNFGFIFNPTEPKTKLVEIDAFDKVNNVQTDKYTGNVYLIRADRLFDWDPEVTERLFWTWKSKEFHLPKPVNFGAVKIKFLAQSEPVTIDTGNADYFQTFNDARISSPLNTLGGHVLGGTQTVAVTDWGEAQNRTALGGSELYRVSPISTQPSVARFRAYANGTLVYDNAITSEEIMRMPTGFKRDVWQFELACNSHVYSVQIAETGKELDKV